ncbi:MAG: hypothetical protein SWH68_03830 [Thermodesulfobacteriota bacterium]|nr:hypothetical protein [Thermodesulfobacteriota bacterium]
MSDSPPRHRPFWVWVISLLYLLTGTLAILSLFRFLGMEAAGDQVADVLAVRQQALAWSMFGLIPAANLAGGILLFMLHRWAFYAFAAALVMNLLNILRYLILEASRVQITSGSSVVGVLFGLGVITAVCVYTWRLRKDGILR